MFAKPSALRRPRSMEPETADGQHGPSKKARTGQDAPSREAQSSRSDAGTQLGNPVVAWRDQASTRLHVIPGVPPKGLTLTPLQLARDAQYREDVALNLDIAEKRFEELSLDKGRLNDEVLVFLATLPTPMVQHYDAFQAVPIRTFMELRTLAALPKTEFEDMVKGEMGISALDMRVIRAGLRQTFPIGFMADR